MKRIFLIRHGRQESLLCNLDVHLSPEGVAQAELLAQRLGNFHFDAFYSSTLLRAEETAAIIGKRTGMDFERLSCLNEIDWGDLTGLSNEEKDMMFGDFQRQRAKRTSDLPFPGGENGEDVFKRAAPFFKKVAESDAENVLAVTHGGLIRCVIAGLLGLPFKHKLAFASSLENTSITEILYDEDDGLHSLERLNDHAHLEGHPELLRSSWLV